MQTAPFNHSEGSDPVVMAYAGDAYAPPDTRDAGAALVLGVLGVTVGFVIPLIFGLLAMILGVLTLVRAKRHPHRYAGRRKAIWGIVLGALGMSAVPMGTLLFAARMRELSVRSVCAANLRGLGQAMYIYAEDEPDGAFPDDVRKLVTLGLTTTKQFTCPLAPSGHQHYFYVHGLTASSDPDSVLMFESPCDHWGDGGHVLYQDGHVEFLNAAELQKVIDANKDRAQ